MKTLILGLIVMFTVTTATAQTESFTVDDRGDWPLTLRATTPAESFARGIADVIRSWGLYNQWTSQAAVDANQAATMAMENRQRWLRAYYEIRRDARADRIAERGPRLTREDLIRIARAGRPEPLGPSEFSPVTGRLTWPLLLRGETFNVDRAVLEVLFTQRLGERIISPEEDQKIRQLTDKMQADLKGRVRQVRPGDYVDAKRFLTSLAHEARQPVDFQVGLVAK